MQAQLSYIGTPTGTLPCAITFRTMSDLYHSDLEDLIVAHQTDDGDLRGSDFVCPDKDEAFRRLREAVLAKYPDCIIDDRTTEQ